MTRSIVLAPCYNKYTKALYKKFQYIKGYSKRIDKANRLVYTFNSNGDVVILSCKGHYQD